MKRVLSLLCLLLLCAELVSAKDYFQQEVKYRINVKLNDRYHTLSATESVTYINHSPDTLTFLWFHLWPNAYASPKTALAKQKADNGDPALIFAGDDDRGFIDSLDFHAGDVKLNWIYHPAHQDICRIDLNRPLPPGDSITISTPFYVKIPDGNYSRMGHIGQAYAITQWYPKPAVYDNNGWHQMPYLDQGEFYSEFGSYDVSITLPRNYVVGATGDRVDGDAEEQWMIERSKEIVSTEKKDMTYPASDYVFKTLHFHQDRVHDFGWFADKRFHVARGEVTLPRTGHTVSTWALYTDNEAALWQNAIRYINNSVRLYSEWVGDYPYKQCTAIDGTIAAGGGMEYPNITIIGSSSGDSTLLEVTIAHEVGHNWFYGMLGSNERDHPWMDEGINSYYEMRYYLTNYPPSVYGNHNDLSAFGNIGKIFGVNKLDYRQGFEIEYNLSATSHLDQAVSTKAADFSLINYGTVLYRKTGLLFAYLHDYLGETEFDNCMQQYFSEWKFKHPQPDDILSVFVKRHPDVSWFFDELIETDKKQDAVLKGFKMNDQSADITVKHKGELTVPVPVSSMLDGKILSTVWTKGGSEQEVVTVPCVGCDAFRVDATNSTIDLYRNNNTMRRSGILRRTAPLKINFLARFNEPAANRIFWLPAIGYNEYNKFMPGIILHNQFIPVRKTEYSAAFLYGTGDQSPAGIGTIQHYFFINNGAFSNITLKVKGQRFAYETARFLKSDSTRTLDQLHYNRIEPVLTFNFRPVSLRSPVRDQISLSAVFLSAENVNYTATSGGYYAGNISYQTQEFYRIAYVHSVRRAVDPWSVQLRSELYKTTPRADFTFRYRISYPRFRKGFDIRVFGGYVFDELPGFFGYNLSDRSSYNQDIMFDELYFGRTESEGLLSRQIAVREGGFKAINPLGSYRQWVAAVNLSADFPGLLPLRFFADFGTYSRFNTDVQNIYGLNSNLSADAGISVALIRDVVEVYVPFLRSAEIRKFESTNKLKLGDQIRFTFNIASLNVLNIRNQFLR